MAILLAIPVLGFATMIQTAILSRITLLSGSADLVLVILTVWALQEKVKTAWHWAVAGGLLVGWISGLPMFIPLAGYLLVVVAARLLQRRVWQAPLLAAFIVVVVGTLISHGLVMAYLVITGTQIQFENAISLVTLPSLLLNMLLVIPTNYLVRDLARLVYRTEIKE